jgi:hypothetical protein
MLAVFVVVLLFVGTTVGQAAAITISGAFHFRDNVGANSLGVPTGDRQIFGATTVVPSGTGTTVTASQGAATVPLDFIPVSLFPNQYVGNRPLPSDPALLAAWTLNATRDGVPAPAVTTNDIVGVMSLPLITGIDIQNAGVTPLTPTIAWTLPDLAGVPVTQLRIRIIDAATNNLFFQAIRPLDPPEFAIPAGLLQPGRTYVFRVMLDQISGGFVRSRSSAFSDPYTPSAPGVASPGFGTAAIDGLLGPGEWDNAVQLDVPINVPAIDGGGTVPGTLYVMNDETNLYFGLKVPRSLPRSNFNVGLDNNHNGGLEPGEDVIGVSPGGFFDNFVTAVVPCPPGVQCSFDVAVGGTQDGQGSIGDNGTFTFYEVAHPFNSGDVYDIRVRAGDTFGYRANFAVLSQSPSCPGNPACFAQTSFPQGFLAQLTVVAPTVNAPPQCDRARANPEYLWPANHRMVPVTITGVTDPDDDTVRLQITTITQDEPVNGPGDGDTSPDAMITDRGLLLRAERAGGGNGRVYHVSFTADDGRGGRCTGEVRVAVPPSMKPGTAVLDDGALYDSTKP